MLHGQSDTGWQHRSVRVALPKCTGTLNGSSPNPPNPPTTSSSGLSGLANPLGFLTVEWTWNPRVDPLRGLGGVAFNPDLRAGVRLFMTAPYNPRTTPIEEHFGVLKTVARFKHMEHADLRRRSFKDYSRRVSRHWATEVILQTDIFAMQDFT